MQRDIQDLKGDVQDLKRGVENLEHDMQINADASTGSPDPIGVGSQTFLDALGSGAAVGGMARLCAGLYLGSPTWTGEGILIHRSVLSKDGVYDLVELNSFRVALFDLRASLLEQRKNLAESTSLRLVGSAAMAKTRFLERVVLGILEDGLCEWVECIIIREAAVGDPDACGGTSFIRKCKDGGVFFAYDAQFDVLVGGSKPKMVSGVTISGGAKRLREATVASESFAVNGKNVLLLADGVLRKAVPHTRLTLLVNSVTFKLDWDREVETRAVMMRPTVREARLIAAHSPARRSAREADSMMEVSGLNLRALCAAKLTLDEQVAELQKVIPEAIEGLKRGTTVEMAFGLGGQAKGQVFQYDSRTALGGADQLCIASEFVWRKLAEGLGEEEVSVLMRLLTSSRTVGDLVRGGVAGDGAKGEPRETERSLHRSERCRQ
jgi:hypothetical protein